MGWFGRKNNNSNNNSLPRHDKISVETGVTDNYYYHDVDSLPVAIAEPIHNHHHGHHLYSSTTPRRPSSPPPPAYNPEFARTSDMEQVLSPIVSSTLCSEDASFDDNNKYNSTTTKKALTPTKTPTVTRTSTTVTHIPAPTTTAPPLSSSNNNNNNKLLPSLLLYRHPTILPSCPHCHARSVRTRIVTQPDWGTWFSCALLLILFWPLCWLPLTVDSMKRTEHYCSHCQESVGAKPSFSDCCVKQR